MGWPRLRMRVHSVKSSSAGLRRLSTLTVHSVPMNLPLHNWPDALCSRASTIWIASQSMGSFAEGFEAAPKFAGARPGKVFRKGRSGLGYYPDAAEAKKEKATEKEAPKLAGGMRKLAIAEDSSSEEEEEVVPIRKLPASSSPPKAGMRALAIEEVEESDEEAPPAKPTPSAAAPAAASSGAGSKAGMKKLAIAEDSSSEEEEVVVPIRKLPASSSPAKAGGMKKVAIAESEGDSSDGAASSSSDDLLCATAAADAPLSAAAAAALAEADAVRMQGNSLFGSSKYEEAVLKYIEITVYL